MTWTIRLPYATPPLSLNGRMHWAQKAEITRKLRGYVTATAGARLHVPRCQRINVTLVYVPRDGRRRDRDNLVATLKPCIDGLVDAGIVPDDSPEYVTWGPPEIAKPNAKDPHLYLTIERLA